MVFVAQFVLPESPVFAMAAPRTAGQGIPVCQVSTLAMAVPRMTVPRMTVRAILVCQVSTLGMAVPRMTVRAILVPQVFLLVVLVMTLVTGVPLVALWAPLFFLGFLVVQVYFFPLESHMVLFLVFSKQNKTKSPINIVAFKQVKSIIK